MNNNDSERSLECPNVRIGNNWSNRSFIFGCNVVDDGHYDGGRNDEWRNDGRLNELLLWRHGLDLAFRPSGCSRIDRGSFARTTQALELGKKNNKLKMKGKFARLYHTGVIVFSAFFLLAINASGSQAQAGKARNRNARPKTQAAKISITEQGYQPISVRLHRNVPARITFLRTTNATCATAVLFPAYGIRRDLPLNQPVVVRLTPKRAGEITFTCGMNMMRGKLIVR